MNKLILLFVAICVVCPLNAQTTTGGLAGKLISTEGNPIEGANLLLSGSSMQGVNGTSTDKEGFFQFSSLSIGTYKLSITHVSFSPLEVNTIPISLGQTTKLGIITLNTGQTELNDVVIIAASPVLSSTAVESKWLSKNILDNIPVGRDFKDAITILPQVNASYFGDGLSIAGGTGSENFFYLDGINVTSIYSPPGVPETFTATGFLPYNFIKEVKVSSSGFEAQYGKALGGNVDVVTQSGSNEFKGQVFGFASGSFLNSVPKGGTTGSAIDKTSNYDGGFSFGGSIIKDKLWYYTAYSYYYNERGVDIKGHGFYPDKSINHVLAAKFDWLATTNTKLNLTMLGNPSESTPVYRATWWYIYPDSITDPEAMLGKYERGGFNAILNGSSKFNQKTQLDYAVNYYKHRSYFGGINDFGNYEPQYLDLTTGIVSGGGGWIERNSLTKAGGKISISHRIDKHNVKVGIEAEYNFLEGKNFTPEPGEILYDGNVYTLTYTSTDNTLNSSTYTGYIQDHWFVANRLSLQLGFRWDGLILKDGSEVLQKFTNQYQPRIGISWFLNEAETKKLSFYYGRVYQWINPIAGRIYSNKLLGYDSLYSMDPRTPGATPYDGFIWNQPSEKPVPPGKYNLDNMDQFSIEYRQLIKPGLRFSVTGLYKYLRDAFFLGLDSANGYQGVNGNPGKGKLDFLPRATRQYWAFELGLNGEHKKNFSYSVHYTWSRNYGNYPGGFLADDQAVTFVGFGSVMTQAAIPNSTGLLPNDRPHVLKLNAAYSFEFGLTAGTYFTVQSGTPLSEYSPGPFLNSRVYHERRGSSGRNPTLWDLNFRFGYKHKKFPGKFYLDIFHVGDPQIVVDRDQRKYLDYDQILLNSNFGKPVRYQPPMALRVGVEFNF